jgi:DNA-directed RNA polymerase specialized sigma24 family protein
VLDKLARMYRAMVERDGTDDARDLVHDFVLGPLPHVVERLAFIPEERQGAYIARAFRNFVLDRRRANARRSRALATFFHDAAVEEPAVADEGVIGVRAPVWSPESLVAAGIAELPERLRVAVGAYLGIGGPARSIRTIAEELGVSRHEAQRAVVDGALGLIVVLGRAGTLGPREVDVCRLVLLNGVSLEDTAEVLGITPHQAREALKSARSAISQHLKDRRTHGPAIE